MKQKGVSSIQRGKLFKDAFTLDSLMRTSYGEGVRIAIVDTGVEPHMLPKSVQVEYYAVRDDAVVPVKAEEMHDGNPNFFHGTHVATTILQIAKKATLVCIKYVDPRFELQDQSTNVLRALRWAVTKGNADIVNASLCLPMDYENDLFVVCQEAYIRDIAIIASEDNNQDDRPSWPALYSTVNGVRSESLILANELVHYWPGLIEFGAAGTTSDQSSFGSSFATARISAISALILSAYPRLHPYELKSALVHLAQISTR